MDYHDISLDVVSNVIGSYDDKMDIIHRRKIGPEWYRRYRTLLPSLAGDDDVMEQAIEDKDEDLIIDILNMVDGDLGDSPGTPPDHSSNTVRLLSSCAEQKFSQKFGERLAMMPAFITNLNLTAERLFRTVGKTTLDPRVMEALNQWVQSLLYFDTMAKGVLKVWIRRYPANVKMLFYIENTEDEAIRFIAFLDKYRVVIHVKDIEEIMENYLAASDPWYKAVEELATYKY
jgi:hypothetical protein